ncbi:MAG: hypothetical protein ACC707_21230, partial [Thiohalomonadales bacterium]
PSEQVWRFYIGTTDSAFRFDTGLSAIKAYRLPKTTKTYKFTLRSYSNCDKNVNCKNNHIPIFIPVVTFLDSRFTPIFSLLPGDLIRSTSTPSLQESQAYEFKLKIEANNQAKFLIIFTTPSLVKNNVEYSYKRAASLYPRSGESISGLPFGEFKISFTPYP